MEIITNLYTGHPEFDILLPLEEAVWEHETDFGHVGEKEKTCVLAVRDHMWVARTISVTQLNDENDVDELVDLLNDIESYVISDTDESYDKEVMDAYKYIYDTLEPIARKAYLKYMEEEWNERIHSD